MNSTTTLWPIYAVPPSKFPGALREIPDPPKKLYARGILPEKDNVLLTVVGSRKYTSYGKDACEYIIRGLRGFPFTIVSGLALGIDAIAHTAALSSGISTLAVPGSGLDDRVLYPRTNFILAQNILRAGGALLSESEPNERPQLFSFPKRNRIMAGMSEATLIIEAGKKSGSLITAYLALDYNRTVFAVPGPVFNKNAEGVHGLLKEGATPVTSADDILLAFNIKNDSPRQKEKGADISDDEQKLLSMLDEETEKDTLVEKLLWSPARVNSVVTMLVLKGFIKDDSGIIRRV